MERDIETHTFPGTQKHTLGIADADLVRRFSHHAPPDEDTGAAHGEIRAAALAFARALNRVVPDGRELSLALTKVEEAMMHGNAGIARAGGRKT